MGSGTYVDGLKGNPQKSIKHAIIAIDTSGSITDQTLGKFAAEIEKINGLSINLYVIGPGQDYEDVYGDFARVRDISETGALLVRPDNIVAWRAQAVSDEKLMDLMNERFFRGALSASISKSLIDANKNLWNRDQGLKLTGAILDMAAVTPAFGVSK